ncbi:MAG: cell division protein FtsQ/DivIB, partial [Romboutsia sp.]|uniref:cell division protein FtsQ/DivIB n=1 Tax=Romboutsia sp. TaxID=1965302 RepID=UPI003F2CEF67
VIKNPYVEDAKIKFKLPRTMVISIEEITPVALLKNDNNYCYISKEGEKIENIQDLKENTDKIIVDIEYKNKNNEIEFENEDVKERLLYLLDCISEDNITKEIYEISFEGDNMINLATKNNTKVILPNDNSLEYNVSRLSKVLVDLKSKDKEEGIIDLTYSNYALYSPK